MSHFSLILIGNGTAAVRTLRVLRDLAIDVPLILADARDTGDDSWRLSLVREALGLGYVRGENLFSPQDPNAPEMLDVIRTSQASLILSVQCTRILRLPMIGLAQHGIVNLHNAPLPLLRGCDPFSWAIHDGLLEMGVSLHQIVDEGVDSGPVLAQRRWPIAEDDTAWDLYSRALREAEVMLQASIRGIVGGSVAPVPQDPRYVTYHPMGQFVFGDLAIEWNTVAVTLGAWIRARIFPPFQVPHFASSSGSVDVLRCVVRGGRGVPGTVLSIAPLRIAAKWGSIEIAQVRYRGTVMSGDAWAEASGLAPGACVANPT